MQIIWPHRKDSAGRRESSRSAAPPAPCHTAQRWRPGRICGELNQRTGKYRIGSEGNKKHMGAEPQCGFQTFSKNKEGGREKKPQKRNMYFVPFAI